MAATQLSPFTDAIPDPVTFEEASALFDPTGHPASPTTLRRWVKEDKLTTEKVGRKVYVSWSDLLEAHLKRTAARLRASSNWP
ncbi:hypothetical protein GCM10018777_55630 [Streptomyces albogriseolus]|uniref:helix-turn-helix domain-containing protein n=1 Tax=Streptomyces TaxID=1883 RepID=UPI001673B3D2|nr:MULTISPECIES: helix-turn-helix domain-containing protein [Streptomyces]GHB15240.1 hypothetical protein GCM10010330_80850 [Streptomyces tendae]GHG32624.1 hypothetical protein GCM10018777_55630 [Streptomyces viridodiastaticus]